jgi:DNA mismatch repair protein MutL
MLEELRHSGFDVNISGGMLIYQATPAGITDFNAETFTATLIESISSTGANIQQELKVKIAKSLAATQCIKTGRKLTPDEMNNLIGELFACEEPRYTPDGRPVIVTFEPREVSARFNN